MRLARDIRGTGSDGSAAKIGRSPEIRDLRGLETGKQNHLSNRRLVATAVIEIISNR